jgi:predicted RNA-binding Zn ribbon-like protein
MRIGAGPFEWSGGHPALDLVNTLDERPSGAPVETLRTYRDLVRFVRLAGLLAPALAARLPAVDGRVGARVVARVRALREHLHDMLVAVRLGRPLRRSDLDAVSAAIQAAHAARRLVASPSSTIAGHDWSRPLTREVPLHACALAVESLLTGQARGVVRKCRAADCGVFFLDTSKAGRRRWCSMKSCGNRQKQRRWRSAAG